MVNDTVGDFIIRIKNAGMVGKTEVSLPYTKHLHAIAVKLADAGYIGAISVLGEVPQKQLTVSLQYVGEKHRINDVRRVSKPGRRMYRKATEIHPVKFGHGDTILSTPKGILTGTEARASKLGGEELFIIW